VGQLGTFGGEEDVACFDIKELNLRSGQTLGWAGERKQDRFSDGMEYQTRCHRTKVLIVCGAEDFCRL
jgi:hypothetical protein